MCWCNLWHERRTILAFSFKRRGFLGVHANSVPFFWCTHWIAWALRGRPGNGASEGRFRFAGYSEETKDLHALCTWAEGRGMPIGSVTGHSKAGTVVTDFAGQEVLRRIHCPNDALHHGQRHGPFVIATIQELIV